MKILLLRFSSIGDIVLTSPIIRCLKDQIPDAEIHYFTKKPFREILEINPNIDKVWIWEKDPSSVFRELKKENFDVIVDLHHNLRSARVKFNLRVKSNSFNKLNLQKYLLVNLKINLLPEIHIVDRYFEAIKSLGVRNDNKGLDFFIPEQDEISLSSLPATYHAGYVVVATGALKNTKRLPTEKLLELLNKIKHPVILLGGPAEKEEGEYLATSLGNNVINYCGKLTLAQSASFIKNAKVVITHDTGLMHIAAAFHKPVISVWGNTVPEFGMYPYIPGEPEKSIIAEVNGLSCRPCSKIGYHQCPLGHFRCMNEQDLSAIAVAADQSFSRTII